MPEPDADPKDANEAPGASEEEVKGIDAEGVSAWYASRVPGTTPPLRFSLIAGGHSNLTYRVVDGAGRATVLRRPPLGEVIATAHDMGREHRIIAALGPTEVPVPPALGLCSDESVNGAPFYVMDFVEGVVIADREQVEPFSEEARRGLAEHVIEILAALHAVDPDDVGLGDLGRREAYMERQLRRWRTQWEKTRTRELPAMEEVYETLSRDVPEQVGASIVHGDYRLGNMIAVPEGRIAAVLDWELCTLGDPLADLGYLLNNWADPAEPGPGGAAATALMPTAAGGFPGREHLLRRYAELTGRDLSRIDTYRAFQYWRLAAIVEGVLSRYQKGVMGHVANTDAFRAQVDGLAAEALRLVRGG